MEQLQTLLFSLFIIRFFFMFCFVLNQETGYDDVFCLCLAMMLACFAMSCIFNGCLKKKILMKLKPCISIEMSRCGCAFHFSVTRARLCAHKHDAGVNRRR